jgi:acylphosphatase
MKAGVPPQGDRSPAGAARSEARGDASVCRRFIVSGRVQGVAYRAWAQEHAVALQLTGWAANLPDGRVEVFACGEPGAIERLLPLLSKGPPAARVDGVEESPAETLGLSRFAIR